MGLVGLVVLVVVLVLAMMSCDRASKYPVLVSDLGEDLALVDLAWVSERTLSYLTVSDVSSDGPASLWVSVDGGRRLLYSFSESHLRWDRACDDPYFFAIEARNADDMVALVDCGSPADRRIATVRTDGDTMLLGSAQDAHDIAWRRGGRDGVVATGSSACYTVLPVESGGVRQWGSTAPPWNLNDLHTQSTCTMRGTIWIVATTSAGAAAFISATPDTIGQAGPGSSEGTLYEIDALGVHVRELVGGFINVRDITSVGDDIVVSAQRHGRSGLWRWVRATGAVVLVAEGIFPRLAAGPSGAAIAAGRVSGRTIDILQIKL